MLFAQPDLSLLRGKILAQSVQAATLDKILAGRFQEVGDDNHVIYAGAVDKSQGYFGDVFVAVRDSKQEQHPSSWVLLSSDTVAEGVRPENGKFFVFERGYRYQATAGEKALQSLQFERFSQRLPNGSAKDHNRYSAMKTRQLIQAYQHDPSAAAELQWRLVNVLSTLLFALLAIPLSEVNPRKGRFAQMLPAIFLYIVYANMMFASKTWMKHETVPRFIGMWWIVWLLLLLGIVLLWRNSAWQQRLRRWRRHASA